LPNEEVGDRGHQAETSASKHEITDLRFRIIAAALVGVGLVLWIVGISAQSFLHRQLRYDAQRLATKRLIEEKLPDQPRLESFEPQYPASESFATNMRNLEDQLHQFGPSQDDGFARVPIEVAIEHMAKQLQAKKKDNLEVRTSQQPIVSGDANSGRVFREITP
jgi:hypothetical protein